MSVGINHLCKTLKEPINHLDILDYLPITSLFLDCKILISLQDPEQTDHTVRLINRPVSNTKILITSVFLPTHFSEIYSEDLWGSCISLQVGRHTSYCHMGQSSKGNLNLFEQICVIVPLRKRSQKKKYYFCSNIFPSLSQAWNWLKHWSLVFKD